VETSTHLLCSAHQGNRHASQGRQAIADHDPALIEHHLQLGGSQSAGVHTSFQYTITSSSASQPASHTDKAVPSMQDS
jgi:hypothetical protein